MPNRISSGKKPPKPPSLRQKLLPSPLVSRRSVLKSGVAAFCALTPMRRIEAAATIRDDAPRVEGLIGEGEAESIAALIREFTETYSLPGFSMALADQGQLKLVACHGYADQKAQVPVTPQHLFRLASVSKPITSATLMRLIEQGALSLNDRVFGSMGLLNDLYDCSQHKDPVNRIRLENLTLEHLLEHTGGGWGNRRRDPMFAREALKFDHRKLIQWTLDEISLQRDPGQSYDYSNFGYCLLGRVIEAVTGQTYDEAVKQYLLTPSGISRMNVARPVSSDRWEQEVLYYQKESDPYGPSMNVHRMDAHGGWVATPTDLMRMMNHIDGFDRPRDILNAESIERMTTPSSPDLTYAKGWRVNASNNWWHQGSFPGGSSFLARIADGTCWAVVVNTRSKEKNYTTALDRLPWKIKRSVKTWGKGNLFTDG